MTGPVRFDVVDGAERGRGRVARVVRGHGGERVRAVRKAGRRVGPRAAGHRCDAEARCSVVDRDRFQARAAGIAHGPSEGVGRRIGPRGRYRLGEPSDDRRGEIDLIDSAQRRRGRVARVVRRHGGKRVRATRKAGRRVGESAAAQRCGAEARCSVVDRDRSQARAGIAGGPRDGVGRGIGPRGRYRLVTFADARRGAIDLIDGA